MTETAGADWWRNSTNIEQRHYLRNHPKSHKQVDAVPSAAPSSIRSHLETNGWMQKDKVWSHPDSKCRIMRGDSTDKHHVIVVTPKGMPRHFKTDDEQELIKHISSLVDGGKIDPGEFKKPGVRIERGVNQEQCAKLWAKTFVVPPDAFVDKLLKGTGAKGKITLSVEGHSGLDTRIKTAHSDLSQIYSRGSDGKLQVHLLEFMVDPKQQGAGFAKTVLRNAMQQYKRMGVAKIELEAESIGSYAWARYGFCPDKVVWPEFKEGIKERAQALLKSNPQAAKGIRHTINSITEDPKSIWDVADANVPVKVNRQEIPLGKALLISNGWAGGLDLKDSTAMQRFSHYVY